MNSQNILKHKKIVVNHKLVNLFYGNNKVEIYSSEANNNIVHMFAKKIRSTARCPLCMKISKTVRSSYTRTLIDLPLANSMVVMFLQVRRFECKNIKCDRKIFSERYNSLTAPYSRHTFRVSDYLSKILIEVSSRKRAYFSKLLNIPTSNSTCLRLVKLMKISYPDKLYCIGIDDWAKRKGMNYGTIIVDVETRRPIDLLDSRDTNDVTEWLATRPDIEYVTRDRANAYTSAITRAIPEAKQIADRFHLVKNLGDIILEEIRQEYPKIKNVAAITYSDSKYLLPSNDWQIESTDTIIDIDKSPPCAEKLDKLEQIKVLKKCGHSISEIARRINMDRGTVRRYLANGIPKNIRSGKKRIKYDRFTTDIVEMCEMGTTLSFMYRSIKNKGFEGSQRSFFLWFNQNFKGYSYKWRKSLQKLSGAIKPKINKDKLPSPRKFSILLTNPDFGVTKSTGEISQEKDIVDRLINKIPLLQQFRDLFLDFRELLKCGNPNSRENWITSVQSINRKRLFSFCEGLLKDVQAVKNAISYNLTNGIVEGHVNRLKNKKREMYGRSGFQLLRRKVCLSKTG